MVAAYSRTLILAASLMLLGACATPKIRPGIYDIVYVDDPEHALHLKTEIIVFDKEIDLDQFPRAVVTFEGNKFANFDGPQNFTVCVISRLYDAGDLGLITNVGFAHPVSVGAEWRILTRATPDFRSWLIVSASDGSCNGYHDGRDGSVPERCRLIHRGEPSLKTCQDAGLEMDEQTRP